MSHERDNFDWLEESDRLERERYDRELVEHPDCRDPDHPTCYLCEDKDETSLGANQ